MKNSNIICRNLNENQICSHLGIESLADANLDGLDLRGADLRGVDFGTASVAGVQWQDANLRGADLSRTSNLDPRALLLAEIDHTTKLPDGTLEEMVPLAFDALRNFAPTQVFNRIVDLYRFEFGRRPHQEKKSRKNFISFWLKPE